MLEYIGLARKKEIIETNFNSMDFLTDLTNSVCMLIHEGLENSVLTYLIPEKCRPSLNEKSSAVKRRTTYMEFYKENLSNAKALIQNINNIELAIHEYLDLRFEEEKIYLFNK